MKRRTLLPLLVLVGLAGFVPGCELFGLDDAELEINIPEYIIGDAPNKAYDLIVYFLIHEFVVNDLRVNCIVPVLSKVVVQSNEICWEGGSKTP